MMHITTDALELMVEQNKLSGELTGVIRSLIDEVKGMARPSNEPVLLNDVDAAAYIGMSAMFLRRARSEGQVGNRTPAPKYVEIDVSGNAKATGVHFSSDEDEMIEQLSRWADENMPDDREVAAYEHPIIRGSDENGSLKKRHASRGRVGMRARAKHVGRDLADPSTDILP